MPQTWIMVEDIRPILGEYCDKDTEKYRSDKYTGKYADVPCKG